MLLPARSPELDPTENVWQYMRQNWLSNRVFKTYDEIIDLGQIRARDRAPFGAFS